jgi:hypothetical protein
MFRYQLHYTIKYSLTQLFKKVVLDCTLFYYFINAFVFVT